MNQLFQQPLILLGEGGAGGDYLNRPVLQALPSTVPQNIIVGKNVRNGDRQLIRDVLEQREPFFF